MSPRLLLMIATAAVVAAVGAGLAVLGSPAQARERRFDQREGWNPNHLRLL